MYWEASISAAHHSMNKGRSVDCLCYVAFLEVASGRVSDTNNVIGRRLLRSHSLQEWKVTAAKGCLMFEYHWSTVVILFSFNYFGWLTAIDLYQCMDASRCLVHTCTPSVQALCTYVFVCKIAQTRHQNYFYNHKNYIFATNHQFYNPFFPFSLRLVFSRKCVTMGLHQGSCSLARRSMHTHTHTYACMHTRSVHGGTH